MSDLLDALLAPLARLLVARGVAFADLTERLKGHYVKAAMAQEVEKPTDSRLSVLTGLSRREVARLRAFEIRKARPNPMTRIVSLWQTHDAYQSHRSLSRTGPEPSFDALARLVLQDVHPRTLLDRLLQAGTVVAEADDRVRLVANAYLPASGTPEQLAYLAQNVGDHLSAATENVSGAEADHFERALHMEDLNSAQVAELAARYAAAQMRVLEELQAKGEEMKREAKGDMRFRAGGYFYKTERGQ